MAEDIKIENKSEVVKTHDNKKVKVKIEVDTHTDGDIVYKKNDTLETDVLTAKWLTDNKVGKLL